MTWWGWVIVGLILAPVIWFGLNVAKGFAVRPEVTGKRYLVQQLARAGVSASRYGDACMTELVDGAIGVAKMRKMIERVHFNNAFIDHLNAIVTITTMYDRGDRSPLTDGGPIVDTLIKYDPALGQQRV